MESPLPLLKWANSNYFKINVNVDFDWQFYFQDGRPPTYELKKQCIAIVDQLFAGHSNGLRIQGLLQIQSETFFSF